MGATKTKLAAAVGGAAALALLIPGVASAAGSNAVQYTAVGNDHCDVTFTIVNHTNSKDYTIDYVIDGEKPTGKDYGTGPTGRIALSSGADDPVFPGSGYVTNREPGVTTTRTIDLRTLLPNLPNPLSDKHTVKYRMILGPEASDRGSADWNTTEVSGCMTSFGLDDLAQFGQAFGSS